MTVQLHHPAQGRRPRQEEAHVCRAETRARPGMAATPHGPTAVLTRVRVERSNARSAGGACLHSFNKQKQELQLYTASKALSGLSMIAQAGAE